MELTPYQHSFLLNHFHEFYREVVRLKGLVVIGGNRNASNPSQPGAGGSGAWQQIVTLLERQAFEAGRSGGAFGLEVFREAQYVMAALADDIFLHLDWDGRTSWPLVESRLFNSHFAGEEVFRKLDRLLLRRDPFYLDLAAVYFEALSLGFQGKYRDSDDGGQLFYYRRQLFAMISHRAPELFTSRSKIMGHAYQYTLEHAQPRKLRALRVWLWSVLIILLAWIGVSHIAWSLLNSGPASRLNMEIDAYPGNTDRSNPR